MTYSFGSTTIQAGPATDEYIARYVMGWSADPEGYWLDAKNNYADTGWGLLDLPQTKNFPACRKFCPSEDIAAAWVVVEKLCRMTGCDVVKVCKRDPEVFDEWSCNFGRGCEAFADTAPLAICRAAWAVRQLLETRL